MRWQGQKIILLLDNCIVYSLNGIVTLKQTYYFFPPLSLPPSITNSILLLMDVEIIIDQWIQI